MILITGATGFVGRSLMRHLAETGIEARALDGRIQNPFALREQLEGVHTVFHLVSAESRGRNRLLRRVDIDGTQTLLEACQRTGVRHIIYLSRIGADPAAWQPLLRAKGEVERMIRRSGLSYTIVRSASAYGWGDRYFEIIVGLAMWSWPFIWLPGNGRHPVQPIWVEDVAKCLRRCLASEAKKDKIFEIAGSERMSYYALTQQLLGMVGMWRIGLPLPLRLLKPLAFVTFRWWYWPAISRFTADRFFIPEVTSTDSVQRLFGFQPRRVHETISYLNRPGLRWRLFRK